MTCAASARMSGVRAPSPRALIPGIIVSAAVAITVRGQSALTAMRRSRNSSAIPSTHMLMPYLAMV